MNFLQDGDLGCLFLLVRKNRVLSPSLSCIRSVTLLMGWRCFLNLFGLLVLLVLTVVILWYGLLSLLVVLVYGCFLQGRGSFFVRETSLSGVAGIQWCGQSSPWNLLELLWPQGM